MAFASAALAAMCFCESMYVWRVLDARFGRSAGQEEPGAARVRNIDRSAVVEDSERVGERARRVAGRPPDGDGGVAERELLAILRFQVALGSHRQVPVRELLDEVPVAGVHEDALTALLEHLRAADVVAVRVRDDHVLDVARRRARAAASRRRSAPRSCTGRSCRSK